MTKRDHYERKFRCLGCGQWVKVNPRLKDQRYCGKAKCQRVRRNRLHKKKLSTDPEYRQSYLDSLAKWRQSHPEYWAEYRKQHPECVESNRRAQKKRDRRRRKGRRVLAKMYALGVEPTENVKEPRTEGEADGACKNVLDGHGPPGRA